MITDPSVGPTLWQQVLDAIRERITPQNYNIWFEPVRASMEGNHLYIHVPNQFFRDWISEHYMDEIRKVTSELSSPETKIDIVCEQAPFLDEEDFEDEDEIKEELSSPDDFSYEPSAPSPSYSYSQPSSYNQPSSRVEVVRSAPPAAPIEESSSFQSQALNERYTFDTFVVGPSNQFAHAACLAVSSDPANSYNPLFLYGGVGLGKTHLLHATGLGIIKANKDMRVMYLSTEQFMNDMIMAIRMDKLVEFRRRYRDQCNVLLIDDIQFIAGKKRTQEEFFHTFNFLHSAGRQIVITSDRNPHDIKELEERLRSRFQWGLTADIQVPELETRMAIISKKSERDAIPLSNDVVLFLASTIRSNIRELEGCLTRLEAYSNLTGKAITLELAREVLHNILPERLPLATISTIQKCVASHYGVKVSDLKTNKRHKQVLLPRQIAMYLCRKRAHASFPEIGEQFGGKDHSTVINACQKIERLLEQDQNIRTTVLLLESRLHE